MDARSLLTMAPAPVRAVADALLTRLETTERGMQLAAGMLQKHEQAHAAAVQCIGDLSAAVAALQEQVQALQATCGQCKGGA